MGQLNGSTYLVTYVQQQSDLVAMLLVSNKITHPSEIPLMPPDISDDT